MSVADRLASLTPEQRALFEALRQKQRQAAVSAASTPPPIERVSGPRGAGDWPLTFDQERLWFLHQLDPTSSSYNMVTATRLTGGLDAAALEAALDAVIDRHGAWRTTFPLVDGRPVQRVASELRLRLPLVDLEGLPPKRREAAVLELAREDARRPFSLERGPLVRATLARLSPGEHVCMLAIHHIVSDLVSFQLFWNELALLYTGSSLPSLPVQYADFAVWQRQWLTGEVLERQLDWWREQLRGFPLVLDLPGDRPRLPEQTSRGGRQPLHLGVGPTEALRTLARREGVTRFMTVLALCAVQLHRLSGQERLIAGTINANRGRPEVEPLLGFFVTQLPLAVDLAGDPTFREQLGRVRTAALGAFAHQHLPFGKLVEALEPERDASRMPVVQTVVQLLEALAGAGDAGDNGEARLGNLVLEGLAIDNGSAAYELMLGFVEYADHLAGHVEYNADLFDRTTVARLTEGIAALLDAAAADPGLRLSALPAFTATARHQMLAEWNATAVSYPPGETLHELIEAQVDRTPDAIAVTFEGASLTFRELDGAANRLARRLRSLDVGPEVRVGVRLERSLEMVVALLAVLKAGGAWVPVDPASPLERQALLLKEADLRLVLSPEWLAAEESSERLASGAGSGNAAYVIFTSGSTGRPKGVVNTHAGIRNRLLWMQEEYGLGAGDRVLQKTPFGFDVSVWEFFWPLMAGARLVMAMPGGHQDPAYLVRTIAEEGVTTLHFVPSMLQAFLEERDLAARVPTLKRVIASGEALSFDLRQRFLARLPGVELHNLYGPTEAAVDVTFWDCRAEAGARVPIGRPVANTRIQLLDRERRPVPIGATGELCIGGVQLARGYLGRPDLTAERFVPDPFVPDPILDGERLYRTGDLARWLPDGAIEYLGRLDFQMKVRGFRVEPGEIEAALTALPGVREAAVLLREDRPGDRRLVAYVTPQDLDVSELRVALRRRLPEPLVPSAFVTLPALPLHANGKLDRRALAAPDVSGAEPDVEPRTNLEREIAAIWTGVLGIERVGVLRSFFDLGGHSLLATQLVMRMRDAFGVELPLRAIFQATTVATQAELVEKTRAGGEDSPRVQPIVRVSRTGDLPLSFAQERLWFLDQLTPGSPVYNVPLALAVHGRLDVPALERAFGEVVRRHETLRTSFPLRGSRPVQEIAPAAGWTLAVEDFSPDAAREEALKPFDLAHGPLLRTRLLRIAPEHHLLLLTVHHIAADLWAAGILVREVAAIYAGTQLPELPIQYADFAAWQRQWLDGAELERQLAFWRRELAGAPPALDLPTDRPRPPVESFRGAGLPWTVDRDLSRGLQELGRAGGATLFMTMIAALGVLLSRWTGQDDLVLGSPIANRPVPELDGLIGMFVNTLAIRVRLAGLPAVTTFTDLLAGVRRTSLDAFEHQDLPFERLVEELKPRRDLSRHPLFQVALALQNVRMGTVAVPGLVFEPLGLASATTKFDLTFTLFEGEDGLAGQVEHATDLFDAATVERLLGHLRNLLAGIAADPGTPVEDLPLLSGMERGQLLAWSGVAPDFPRQTTIHGLFAEQAARTPDAVAVVHEDETLTYGELARRAGRIAARLLKLGVKPETRVAVMGERSLDLIVALLGILQAGCAYLPLDPEHPAERQRLILTDAGASLLLSREEEGDWGTIPPPVSPDQLAYVMYTSGSTGKPKGVAVTHRNVVRLVRGSGFMAMGPEQTFLQLAPVAFDASTLEIWAPLLNGGRVVLFPGRRASLDEIGETVARHGVTSMFLTTGLFHQMVDERLEALRPLRQLLTGGEVISPAYMRRALAGLPGCRVIACYGPTENTTFTTTHPMTAADLDGPVPLGHPIGGTRVYVLDAALRPVPEGVWGELCAGGDGVARGYLGRPDLTAERFVPDPYGPKPGGRLYRTGDLVRWRGGVLEFLGRRDGQVKLRGNRIEMGEVEAALTGHPAVREAVVVLREERLAAYVTGDPDPVELRRFLAARLPDPMIPSAFVVLDRLPLTPNGKVDRRVLPAPEGRGAVESYVPPETPVEESLTAACAEVLGVERVGVRDNFFALGGHSLLATRLVARLRERYGLDVPLQMVFDAVDLRDLADRIVERKLAGVDDSVLAELLGEEVG